MTSDLAAARHRAGVGFALAAFGFWGVGPIYFKLIAHVPAAEIIAHRVIWALLLLGLLLAAGWRLAGVAEILGQPRRLGWLAVSAALLAVNWLTFVWAVTHDRILETSLGYYINPLVSVVLGMVFLGERLRPWQWVAVALAAAATAQLALRYGQWPWVSLVLAVCFGFYGLVRKRLAVGAMAGLFIETALMAPVALLYLAWLAERETLTFLHAGGATDGLLLAAGLVTVFPLVCFAAATRRLPLATVGLFQYIAPSLSFLLGVFVYDEPFTGVHALTFAGIWTALALYSGESALRRRLAMVRRRAAGTGPTAESGGSGH